MHQGRSILSQPGSQLKTDDNEAPNAGGDTTDAPAVTPSKGLESAILTTSAQVHSSLVKDLRQACAHYGLETKGKKATLQATLLSHFDTLQEQSKDNAAETSEPSPPGHHDAGPGSEDNGAERNAAPDLEDDEGMLDGMVLSPHSEKGAMPNQDSRIPKKRSLPMVPVFSESQEPSPQVTSTCAPVLQNTAWAELVHGNSTEPTPRPREITSIMAMTDVPPDTLVLADLLRGVRYVTEEALSNLLTLTAHSPARYPDDESEVLAETNSRAFPANFTSEKYSTCEVMSVESPGMTPKVMTDIYHAAGLATNAY